VRRVVERALALALLLATGRARADPAPAGPAPPDAAHTARLAFVRGSGAEGCPDEEALRGAVARRLGYDPFRADAPRSLEASVRVVGSALHGVVRLRDATGVALGTRYLSEAVDGCAELVAAMALAISIAIDPKVLVSSAPPSPPPPVTAPPPGRAPPAPASPAPDLPVRAAGWTGAPDLTAPPLPVLLPPAPLPPAQETGSLVGWVGLGGLVAGGAAPGVSGGVTLDVGLRWRSFTAAVEGRVDPPVSTGAQGGGSVSAALYTVGVVPCFVIRFAAFCAVGSAGVLHGAGSGVANAKTATTPFGELGPRVGLAFTIGARFEVEAHGDLAFPVTRTTLYLDGRGVWNTPTAGGSGGAGVRVHFP
jgi:hypothetical protein